jgi:hypothetical protein
MGDALFVASVLLLLPPPLRGEPRLTLAPSRV